MRYRLKLLITVSALLCLLLAVVAPAANTKKTLYLDGVKIEDDSNNTSGLTWPAPPKDRITIGAENDRWYLYNEYIGKIDEFAIYAGILDANRIKAHYDANGSVAAYDANVTLDNPLLWLKFNDANMLDGATALNSGSIGINGTYVQTGGGAITQVTGISADGNAMNIPDAVADGPGHCVDVWDGNGDFSSDLEGDVTVELWVKYTDWNTTTDWARFYQHGGGYGLMVSAPNEVGIQGGDATNYIGFTYDINDDQWHHVVVTYESTYDAPNLPDVNTYVEEVNADNPVLWLRFEDSQPKDYSAADGNHWVGYGTAASIVDKVGGIGKSVKLDGSSGQGVYGVAATNNPNSPPLDPNTSIGYEVFGDQYAFAPNDITFEIWYKSLPIGQTQPANYGIFFQQIGAYTHEPNAPAVSNASGQIRVFGGDSAWYSGVNPKFDQQWHQLVVTYDEDYNNDPCSMYVQLYLDGIEKGNHTFTAVGAKLGPELSHILIGAENDIGNTYNVIAAYYDEFAIYAGILDPNRVMAHYSAWQVKDCTEMWERGYGQPSDTNKNCKTDFADFASFALSWRQCNDPCDPSCTANW